MGQGELVATALLGHHQLDRIGHQFQGLVAPAGVEHQRMADECQQSPIGIEVVGLLAIPAGAILADGPQHPAVVVAQVIEPRVLLVQPLHGHRPARGPTVPPFGRLLHHVDRPVLGIDEPHQPFRLARGRRRRRADAAGLEKGGEAVEGALPGLAQLDELGELDHRPAVRRGAQKGVIGRRLVGGPLQHLGVNAGNQRQHFLQGGKARQGVRHLLGGQRRIGQKLDQGEAGGG